MDAPVDVWNPNRPVDVALSYAALAVGLAAALGAVALIGIS